MYRYSIDAKMMLTKVKVMPEMTPPLTEEEMDQALKADHLMELLSFGEITQEILDVPQADW